MKKITLMVLLVQLIASCQNKNSEISQLDKVEKLSPQIRISKGENSNERGVKSCKVELKTKNSIETIDEFFPSFIEREDLIYCDLALNQSGNGLIEIEDLRKELHPKRFGKLLYMSFAATVEERLYIPINRYWFFTNRSRS